MRLLMKNSVAFLLPVVALLLLSPFVCLAHTKTEGVTHSVIVKAPREAVWKAVIAADKYKAHVCSTAEHEAIVEQTFEKIPFLGTVRTTQRVKVKPQERVTYEMIESDKFKDMSGSWVITPIDSTSTKLQLNSYVDPGIPVPRFLINRFLKGKVESRLEKTKRIAEDMYAKQSNSASSSTIRASAHPVEQ